MARVDEQDEGQELAPREHRVPPRRWPRRWPARIGLGSAVVLLAVGGTIWMDRERLAGDIIDDYLAENGIAARYDIIAIGPRLQVIENLVVGDPARPDLTAQRVVVELGYSLTGLEVSQIEASGVRVSGSYRSGTFSLGSLDPLLFTGSDEPAALPSFNVVLRDARGLIESDFGRIGLRLDGAGRLDDGFAGTLAATAPGIGTDDCRAERATFYGKLTTEDGAPAFDGPLRLAGVACAGASMAQADIGSRIQLSPDLTQADGEFAVTGSTLGYATLRSAALSGTARLGWSQRGLAVDHDLTLADLALPEGALGQLTAEGAWRGDNKMARSQWEGRVSGTGMVPGRGLLDPLAQAERGLDGTLLAPLLRQARGNLANALDGAGFAAEAIVRQTGENIALIVPEAELRTRAGVPVLALSQVSGALSGAGLSGLRGNFVAGGEGLPAVNGRMEQRGPGGFTARLAMAEYRSGINRLAVPRFDVRQERPGLLRFAGLVTASGALPGGEVQGLELPLEGSWSQGTGVSVGTACTRLRFSALALSGLALEAQRIELCPERRGPMLAYNDALTIAARVRDPLVLSGTMGESPARISATSAVLRYPEPFALEGLAARFGVPGSEIALAADQLTGSLSGDIGGQFSGGSAQLPAVPLDLSAIAGRWRFAEGTLRLEDARFAIADRPVEGEARFVSLEGRAASLVFEGSTILADTPLYHGGSGRQVAVIDLRHDLESAGGGARITMPGLVFDEALQPDELSYLAKGVIAVADGTVTGEGRIDWTADGITSGGTFGSENLDFAAAFGPVRGLAGRVRFTDLLNLTTAPDQVLTIAAINPGIEVLGGRVQFDVEGGTLLRLDDARFPFMGGELRMRPLAMDFSQPEQRRYIFDIAGLDAATFVAEMELTNLSATGTFDGSVPIIFDANGNGRIEGGALMAREGGGNLAYIGDLTYEDLGAMGNYAFSALRSLDYRQMRITLNGDLAGEIVTSFNFDGVRQGAGASRNFITRRLAKLPIQFRINVRSESFTQLALIVRGAFDPTAWGDPFALGLLRYEDGKLIRRPSKPAQPAPPISSEPRSVQPSESDPLR